MTPNILFNIFKTKFLSSTNKTVKEWFPNGRGSIRVVLEDRNVLVFRYENENEWTIETMKNFLKRM